MQQDAMDEVMSTFREEALELVRRVLATLNRLANEPTVERAKRRKEIDRLLHTLKGAAAAVGNEQVKQRTHALEDRIAALGENDGMAAFDPIFRELELIEALCAPGEAPAPAATPAVTPNPWAAPQVAAPAIVLNSAPAAAANANSVSKGSAPMAAPEGHGFAYTEWLRLPPERIDQLHAHLGELTLSRLQNDQLVTRFVQLRAAAAKHMARQRELNRLLSELRPQLGVEAHHRLRVVSQSLSQGWGSFLDDLQSSCREARVLQAQSSVVSQGVEESIQELRLMPLAPFFESFARTARDAARHSHKQVRFHVQAEGAEVDRAVLTRLSDALLHLVRNAVVHGIEEPHVRQSRGKPAEGNLTLEASSAGTQAVIRVIDDGGGVDTERVQHKAKALGIAASDDLLALLTHPGFSTRETADELSGRGVGLDVVASLVRDLDGSLELDSQPGRGTTFTVRVPIAASTTMGLLLQIGDQRFAVMLSSVERVLRPRLSDVQDVEGRPAVLVGEERVALAPLSELLGLPDDAPEQSSVPVIVLQHARRRLAVSVRDIPSEQELVVRPFGRALRDLPLFVGGAVQPDHSVVPVLSTAALFARAAGLPSRPHEKRTFLQAPRAVQQVRALVVDDSITMRTMLRNVLSAAGYEVVVAEDGVAALELLAGMKDCQILVTDLQMPHMDGVELCKRVRARPGPYLPIIMVTSVDADEEKSRALAAGADAYVVKAMFEQTSFLRRVDTLVSGPT